MKRYVFIKENWVSFMLDEPLFVVLFVIAFKSCDWLKINDPEFIF